jgi:hypothetical protein
MFACIRVANSGTRMTSRKKMPALKQMIQAGISHQVFFMLWHHRMFSPPTLI